LPSCSWGVPGAVYRNPPVGAARVVVSQCELSYMEGARNPRVMALAVHPYISGVPHRIKYFEAVYDYMRKKPGVWFTTGEEICEWYKSRK
jgi:allantoinase